MQSILCWSVCTMNRKSSQITFLKQCLFQINRKWNCFTCKIFPQPTLHLIWFEFFTSEENEIVVNVVDCVAGFTNWATLDSLTGWFFDEVLHCDRQNYYVTDFYMIFCITDILIGWLINELIDGRIKQSTSVAAKFNNLLLLVSQGHQNLKIKIVKLNASNSVTERILIEIDWCLTNWSWWVKSDLWLIAQLIDYQIVYYCFIEKLAKK